MGNDIIGDSKSRKVQDHGRVNIPREFMEQAKLEEDEDALLICGDEFIAVTRNDVSIAGRVKEEIIDGS